MTPLRGAFVLLSAGSRLARTRLLTRLPIYKAEATPLSCRATRLSSLGPTLRAVRAATPYLWNLTIYFSLASLVEPSSLASQVLSHFSLYIEHDFAFSTWWN